MVRDEKLLNEELRVGKKHVLQPNHGECGADAPWWQGRTDQLLKPAAAPLRKKANGF